MAQYEVMGCAPNISELAASGKTFTARSLSSHPGGQPRFVAEPWRNEDPAPIDTRALFQVLRIKLSARSSKLVDAPAAAGTVMVANEIGGLTPGMAMSGGSRMQRDVTTSDILDLHMTDGAIIRINGDKFNYDVLGAKKGYSDGANTDQLAVMVAEAAPMATLAINERISGLPRRMHAWWRRNGPKTPLIGGVPPTFELYSRWATIA